MKTQPSSHVEHSFRQHATRVITLICIVLGCVSVIIPLFYGGNVWTGLIFTAVAFLTYWLSLQAERFHIAAIILVVLLILSSFLYAFAHGVYGALAFFLMMLSGVVASLTLSMRVAFFCFVLEIITLIPLAIYQHSHNATIDTSTVVPDTLMALLIAATMYFTLRILGQQLITVQGREHAHLKELEVYNTQMDAVLEKRVQELETSISNRTQRLQHLAQRGKELSHITHDVSNALTSLRLVLDQNLESLPEKDREQINSSFEYLRKIMQSTTKDKGQPIKRVSVLESVQIATNLLEKTLARNRISVSIDVPDATLAVEPEHLQRILSNFLQNSIDAFSEMKQKRVHKEIRIVGKMQNHRYTLTVQDNGPGIPEHLIPLIKEPWFSTKGGEHIGMGLSGVSDLINLYKDAQFSIESRAHHFTKMTISFPV